MKPTSKQTIAELEMTLLAARAKLKELNAEKPKDADAERFRRNWKNYVERLDAYLAQRKGQGS